MITNLKSLPTSRLIELLLETQGRMQAAVREEYERLEQESLELTGEFLMRAWRRAGSKTHHFHADLARAGREMAMREEHAMTIAMHVFGARIERVGAATHLLVEPEKTAMVGQFMLNVLNGADPYNAAIAALTGCRLEDVRGLGDYWVRRAAIKSLLFGVIYGKGFHA